VAGLVVAFAGLAACAQPPAGGGGIVSTNPCADAILVRLVAPERIAAISHYSHDPASTSIPVAEARRFRATAGTAEEVVAMRPDLVLASSFTPPATRAAFDRAGLRTLYLGSPTTVAASRAQVEEIAAAIGAPDRGRVLTSEIDAALRAGSPEQRDEPAALLFIAGTLANGSGTLLDELLTRAGFANAAARYGLEYTGTLPAERIVTDPPAVIIAPDADGRVEAMRRRLLPRTPIAAFPRELVNCGGPSIAPALARLRAIRASLP
jgi:iron complex transport system substrate-binding protein